MNELDTGDRAQRALALLGLRMDGAESVAVGEEPSAEDFAALYEGELEAARRAQVLSHIASNPAIYRRWIDAVAAMGAMDTNPLADTAEKPSPEPFLQRALNWLREGFRTPALVGSVSAAALVAILVILPFDDVHADSWSVDGQRVRSRDGFVCRAASRFCRGTRDAIAEG